MTIVHSGTGLFVCHAEHIAYDPDQAFHSGTYAGRHG